MGETAPTALTADITDHDLREARTLLAPTRWAGPGNPPVQHAELVTRLAALLSETRLAAFAAGLEERADEAHAAGYAEGLADGIDKGRERAVAPFDALFAGGPDTPCRTTWRGIVLWDDGTSDDTNRQECVEVPMDDLRAAFDEAQRA